MKRCALCGMGPMPIAGELPDGSRAHPGCITDPVFADDRRLHGEWPNVPAGRCRCSSDSIAWECPDHGA